MKVSIIGAGNVGTGVADALVLLGISKEIVLYNRNIDKALGQVLDLEDSIPLLNGNIHIDASNSLEDTAGSDIIVITIGAKQASGQTRLDLLKTNALIIKKLMQKLDAIAIDSKIIVVSNPVDVLTRVAQDTSKRDKIKIFGSGTVLDTMRLKEELGIRLNINRKNIHAFVVGEHGDSEFILWSASSVGPIPIEKMNIEHFEQVKLEILEKVRRRAYKIIEKKGYTKQAIGVAVAKIIKAILYDERKIFTLSTQVAPSCQDINVNMVISQPCVLGKNGIEEILLLDCKFKESELLKISIQKLEDSYQTLNS